MYLIWYDSLSALDSMSSVELHERKLREESTEESWTVKNRGYIVRWMSCLLTVDGNVKMSVYWQLARKDVIDESGNEQLQISSLADVTSSRTHIKWYIMMYNRVVIDICYVIALSSISYCQKNCQRTDNELLKICQRTVNEMTKNCWRSVEKLTKNWQRTDKELTENCQRTFNDLSKNWQRTDRKMSKNWLRSLKELTKNCPKAIKATRH